MSADRPLIGVLALQGSFREHCVCLAKAGATPVEVRKAEQLHDVRGLVIPGGESTTMALVAERWGLIPALRQFAASGRPIWGTCAGLIFLADRAVGQKQGGQALIGGLDITVSRNFFGSQIDSFEMAMPAPPALPAVDGLINGEPFRAVFIRAPAIVSHGAAVEVLAEYHVPEGRVVAETQCSKVAVAVRQGQLLGTAFHPELTADTRWHRLFVNMCEQAPAPAAPAALEATGSAAADCLPLVPPPPLPVF